MKNVKDIIPKDGLAPEQNTTYKIEVEDFDPTFAYLEVPEELDKKMITFIEREVRNSYEYRSYVQYLKNELDLTKCSLLPGLDAKTMNISLEFHHYPLTLFDIVGIVGKKMIEDAGEGHKVSCLDIAQKVVEEHYKNCIGLVPLTKSLHEMAHNRSIIIPIDKVHGDYKNFMLRYNDAIDEDLKTKVTEAEAAGISDDLQIYNNTKLEKNISFYNVTYKKPGDDGDTQEVPA